MDAALPADRLEEGEFLHTAQPPSTNPTANSKAKNGHVKKDGHKHNKNTSVDSDEIASFPLIDEDGRPIPRKHRRTPSSVTQEYIPKKNTCVNASITLASIATATLMIVLFVFVANVENFHELIHSSPHPSTPPVTQPDGSKNLIVAQNGAVAADSEVCSKAGVSMLSKGGNAVDAAIATTLCLGVVHPPSSGIGGGAVILVSLANGVVETIDSREIAPSAATQDMFVGKSSASQKGAMSIAVPGELAGLEYAWKKYGSLPWADLFEPAIQLAAGFQVDRFMAEEIRRELPMIEANDLLSDLFLKAGQPKREGEIVRNPELEATLRKVAEKGAWEFYNPTGTIAPQLVADVRSGGGILSLDDMEKYYKEHVMTRETLVDYYDGFEVLTASAPFGGPCILLALNILEYFDIELDGLSPLDYHWMIESLAFAFSDRLALGDPRFVPMEETIATMLNKQHATKLRGRLWENATFPIDHYIDLVNFSVPVDDHGTSHVSVVDKDRNAVSLTSTINLPMGSGIISASTGVVLNDEMDDFSSPGFDNFFNLPPSVANFIAPGKTPMSSMSPTILKQDGELFFVAGASGGTKIITSILQVLLHVAAANMNIYDAIAKPRFHYQLFPKVVFLEEKFPEDVKKDLAKKGHHFSSGGSYGIVQGIVYSGGNLYAASDPRKGGRAAGY